MAGEHTLIPSPTLALFQGLSTPLCLQCEK